MPLKSMINEILIKLYEFSEKDYSDFSKKLIPDTSYPILGIRVPKLKSYAKEIARNDKLSQEFLRDKHCYYEEYFLHALIIAYKFKDLNQLLRELNVFLPHIDNWAICDSFALALKIFKNNPDEVYNQVKLWLKSDKPYVVRFGVVICLGYFLDENFTLNVFDLIKNVKSDNYYVNMSIAWFLSVALVKQYESTIGLIENRVFPEFIHNKAIQKAIESFRISNDKKNRLKLLKFKQTKGESL